MTEAENKAYKRGYNARRMNRWPACLPPIPVPVVQRMFAAIAEVRSKADAVVATLDPDDELAKALDALVDEADAARAAVVEWMNAEMAK